MNAFGLSPLQLFVVTTIAGVMIAWRLPVIWQSLDRSVGAQICRFCGRHSLHPSHCLHCGQPRRPFSP